MPVLATYLNDHLTDETLGIELARRAGAEHKGTRLGTFPVALESLDLRINKKLDLWNALRTGIGDRVDGFDFDEQIRRAEIQAEVLVERRLTVAADALS